MIDGLYSVTFSTPAGDAGGGVVVFRGTKVQGGDDAYYYDGEVTHSAGQAVDATVVVRKHGVGVSIFGDLEEFKLRLRGVAAAPQFHLDGEVIGNPAAQITVRCRRLAD